MICATHINCTSLSRADYEHLQNEDDHIPWNRINCCNDMFPLYNLNDCEFIEHVSGHMTTNSPSNPFIILGYFNFCSPSDVLDGDINTNFSNTTECNYLLESDFASFMGNNNENAISNHNNNPWVEELTVGILDVVFLSSRASFSTTFHRIVVEMKASGQPHV